MRDARGVLIMPENDDQMIKAKHWLIARGKTFKTFYLPITVDSKAPVIMTEFDWTDKLLYMLTFRHKAEKLTAFS